MRNRLHTVIAALIILVLVLSACATAATEAPTQAPAAPTATTAMEEPSPAPAEPTEAMAGGGLPEVDAASLEGDIYAAGSSTVYPLTEAIVENFVADGFTGEVKLDSIGSGAGFERFCKTGETDISNASRAIRDTEIENCKAIDRTPVEFLVGLDAIAVVVSTENDFLENLTMEELGKVMAGEVATWAEVNPDWPAEPIQRFTPGTDSGTFDFFVEVVYQGARDLASLDEGKQVALANSQNLQTSEDDNVLVQGVEGSPYAIGYFGYAYYQEQQDRLKLVSLDDVAPSLETAESGEYALSRPLFIYSDAQIMKDKPQVAGFINYYLTNVTDVIEEVGYFPASEERLQKSIDNWLAAVQ